MSWDQLRDILAENREIAREADAERANPTKCPRCTGEIEEGPAGEGLHCRFDGWRQHC